MKISVVIAAYNESENIGHLTSRLIKALDGMQGSCWELVYVIDGTDGTVDIAREFASSRPEIRIFYNESPSGLGRAFRRGFDQVSPDSDLVVTMDADLNHQPEEIPRLVGILCDQSAGIVIGSRRLAESETLGFPVWKNILSRAVNRLMQILAGVPVRDMTSGFRVYRAELLRRIQFENTGFAFIPEILIDAAQQGAKIVETPIRFVFRESGESKMAIPATSLAYVKLFSRRLFGLRRRSSGPN